MLDALYTDLLRSALRELTPASYGWALDLGCGVGSKIWWIQEFRIQDSGFRIQDHGKATLIGIDIDHQALVEAQAAHLQSRWLCGDARALPLTTESIDLIWCVAMLGLIADPAAALREAWRVLRPGGTLITAQATQRWVRLREPAPLPPATMPTPRAPADDLGHESAEQLHDAGFTSIQVRAYLLDPPGLSAAAAQAPLLDHDYHTPIGDAEPLPVLILVAGRKHARVS